MNTKTKLFSLLFITAALAGCDAGSESPFSPGNGASSGTNIISDKNFVIGVDADPEVITDDGVDLSAEVEVVISAGDRLNLPTTGATVYLEVDWGILSASSCQIQSTGQCSITWTASANTDDEFFPGRPGGDGAITFTAWALGEESFIDLNGNGSFDEGDKTLNDTSGPFLDLNHDGVFTFGTDKVLVPGNSNGVLTPADNLYNGQDCAHPTLCSSSTTVYISDSYTTSIVAN